MQSADFHKKMQRICALTIEIPRDLTPLTVALISDLLRYPAIGNLVTSFSSFIQLDQSHK